MYMMYMMYVIHDAVFLLQLNAKCSPALHDRFSLVAIFSRLRVGESKESFVRLSRHSHGPCLKLPVEFEVVESHVILSLTGIEYHCVLRQINLRVDYIVT